MKSLCNQKGFTLIEAVLAMLVLSITISSSLVLFKQSTEHSSQIDKKTIGTQLASEFLEKIIADKNYQGFAGIAQANYPPFDFEAPYAGFRRFVMIKNVDADLVTEMPDSDFKKVVVIVGWGNNDNDDPSQKTSVSTVLTAH